MAKRVRRNRTEMQALPWLGLSAGAVDAMIAGNARIGRLWIEAWQEMSREVGSFATRRWRYDGDMVHRFCDCRTLVDFLALQAEFCQRTLGDYMREFTRLTDMETDAATAEIEEMGKAVHNASEIVATGDAARAAHSPKTH